jgi:hypothetical protein
LGLDSWFSALTPQTTEALANKIRLEESQADRSKKPFEPQPMPLLVNSISKLTVTDIVSGKYTYCVDWAPSFHRNHREQHAQEGQAKPRPEIFCSCGHSFGARWGMTDAIAWSNVIRINSTR